MPTSVKETAPVTETAPVAATEPKVLNFGGLKITRTFATVKDSERTDIQKNGFTASIIADGETITFPTDAQEEWAEMEINGKVTRYRAFFTTDERPVSSASFGAQCSKSLLVLAGDKQEFVNPTFAGVGINRLTAMLAGKSLKVHLMDAYAQQFSEAPDSETGKYEQLTIMNPKTGFEYRKLKAKKFAMYTAI